MADGRVADVGQPLGKLDGAHVGASAVARDVRERPRLLRHGVGELTSPVTGGDVPEAGQSVDALATLGIGQHGAGARDPHPAVRVVARLVERVDKVREIAVNQGGRRHVSSQDSTRNRPHR